MPHEAAIIGDKFGDEFPLAVAVDELGYIIVAGWSDSNDANWFGGTMNLNSRGLIYIKTHWNLHFECDQVITAPYEGRKIFEPRKFNDNHGVNFMYNVEDSWDIIYTTPWPVGENYRAHAVNEQTLLLPAGQYDYDNYINVYVTDFGGNSLCRGFVSMSSQNEFKVYRGKDFSIGFPHLCSDKDYDNKFETIDDYGALVGATFSTGATVTTVNGVDGVTTANEGIIYLDQYFVTDYSYGVNGAWDNCPKADWRQFYDNDVSELSKY